MLKVGKAKLGSKQYLYCYSPSKSLPCIFVSWKSWEALSSLLLPFPGDQEESRKGLGIITCLSKSFVGAGRGTQRVLSEHHGHQACVLFQHHSLWFKIEDPQRAQRVCKVATEENKGVF